MNVSGKMSELHSSLLEQKGFLHKAVLFSVFTNLLVMAPTVYMLEVYDRVVNSRSLTTLAWLTAITVLLLLVKEVLEWVRQDILECAARKFDSQIGERVFESAFEATLRHMPGASNQVFNDLRSLREFMPSTAMMAMLDAPLALLYVLVIFGINPVMGYMSIVGALIQVGLASLTERATQPPLAKANRASIHALNYANSTLKNAQVIEAMGMLGNIHGRWTKGQQQALRAQANASDAAASYAAVAKFVQMAQGSLLLGAGCWLIINGLFANGGGLMVMASVLGGRVLAPISQLIGSWKMVANARDAYGRVDRLLGALPSRVVGMALPAPHGHLAVEAVTAAAPNSNVAIIRGASFSVPAGQVLAIVGPSASGKSTMARLIVGVWPTASGKVRLDGVDIFQWNKAELGPYMGYLPQDVELFDGTLAQNIARFGFVDSTRVEEAARLVGLHESIMTLDKAYDSAVGDDGSFLSGGMRQRIGLARAVYGNPRLLVLDEPNSSLDEAGERALLKTLRALKARGTTIVVVSHRTSILDAVDLMLVLVDGQVKAFGQRDEILVVLGGKPLAQAQASGPGAAIA
jgi:ATP-binding cassette subfamily C exporter for protease/lipase